MLSPIFGYKIMFTFDNPDGSQNGGVCDSPHVLGKLFEIVAQLEGTNLVIEDKTIYKEIALNDANSVSTH